MTEVQRKTFKRIGVVGYLARGIVLGIIGGLFLKAASTVDASEAKGTEGAFQFLQNTPLGPWLLAIVAFGLAAFGGYCIMLARYRSIRRP